MTSFPDEVLEHVLNFLPDRKDRNTVSLVCKSWWRTEGWNRKFVYIGNCYAVSPEILIRRFPRIKSVILKGKPRFADFGLVPHNWGAFLNPWVIAMAPSYPWLEELRLKRMTVSDESLATLARSFQNFKVLVLISCDGFSTDGIAAIASQCRNLTELDLQECDVEDRGSQWLNCFPETCNSLVSLNFACIHSEVNFEALENLVARCSSLKKLRLNKEVSLEQLQRLLIRAPQLTDLGTGSYTQEVQWSKYAELETALGRCTGLTSLSGFWRVEPMFIPSLYPLGHNLISLNLSYASIRSAEFCKLISHCSNLQSLWVLDEIEDKGLQAVGETCKDLQLLRVFPADPTGVCQVTEIGLVAISEGCKKLSSVLYFCRQCTNAAIEIVALNCKDLISFRLCIITPREPDYVTGEPMDEAFGHIVKHCKSLRRLAVSGLLSDKAFEYIGTYGKQLEMLSVAFAGRTDRAMKFVLEGCKNLRKLEIRDSPFGDDALVSCWRRYESMRFLWMSNCNITINGCIWLANKLPSVNVELIRESDTGDLVERLYAYRSLAGPRRDAPYFVVTL